MKIHFSQISLDLTAQTTRNGAHLDWGWVQLICCTQRFVGSDCLSRKNQTSDEEDLHGGGAPHPILLHFRVLETIVLVNQHSCSE